MYHTEGIILAYYNSGEANKFLVAYTKDFGLLRIFAKSIRMAKSKLSRHAALFSHSRLSFVYGRDFLRLTDAELITSFSPHNPSLMAAGKISRLVVRLVNGEEKDDNLWQLLDSAFGFLREAGKIPDDFDLL
ncbi:MAG: recombination protein O N-terminal domain-containing protein, partial [Patescibacteria group bacterium]